jgi:hypothetical protein
LNKCELNKLIERTGTAPTVVIFGGVSKWGIHYIVPGSASLTAREEIGLGMLWDYL